MIVCPACRASSQEGSERCAACGASLAPGPTQLRARRAPSERPQIEIERPAPPSRWRPVVVLGSVLAAAAAIVAFLFLRPDPCRGLAFVSDRFGYCVDLPDGWSAAPARFGTVTLDQFSADGGSATVVVEAVDLPTGTSLQDWADGVRSHESDAGLDPGAATPAQVVGVDALTWDLAETASGGTDFRTREFVLVRGDVGWRITLHEVAEGFDVAADALDRLLATWRFA